MILTSRGGLCHDRSFVVDLIHALNDPARNVHAPQLPQGHVLVCSSRPARHDQPDAPASLLHGESTAMAGEAGDEGQMRSEEAVG